MKLPIKQVPKIIYKPSPKASVVVYTIVFALQSMFVLLL